MDWGEDQNTEFPIFGGWVKAQPAHFGDGGVFDQIYKPGN
jgi:ABC-type sulfate transport system substrate-binding protein